MGESITLILALVCTIALLLYAMRIAYRLGRDEGYRVGYREGVRFGHYKLLEARQNDGYDSYN